MAPVALWNALSRVPGRDRGLLVVDLVDAQWTQGAGRSRARRRLGNDDLLCAMHLERSRATCRWWSARSGAPISS
jgi:hypothetical protein